MKTFISYGNYSSKFSILVSLNESNTDKIRYVIVLGYCCISYTEHYDIVFDLTSRSVNLMRFLVIFISYRYETI